MKISTALLSTCILATGCASSPSLIYKKISPNDKDPQKTTASISDSYYLNASVISIIPQASKDPKKPEPLVYTVNSDPVEFTDFKVGIIPTNSVFSTTKVNIIKAENSDRVASGGVETTDNVKTLISTIGGIATPIVTTITAASPGPSVTDSACTFELTKPFTVDVKELSTDKSEIMEYKFASDAANSKCVHIEFGPVPPDAVKIENYPWDIKTSNYYYSACRNAKVTVTYPDKRTLVKSVRIADPRYVQFVQYPYKGSVTMHSQCGVSVKTEASASPFTGLDAISELLKQVDAIKNTK